MDPLIGSGAKIVRLDEVIPIYEDEPTALASLIV